MVITILEAEVQQQQWEKLKQAYHDKTKDIPDFVVQSYLVQSRSNPAIWRIITAWRSQADLDTVRHSGETPTGVLIFHAAEATPKLSMFEVAKAVR